MKRLSLLFTVLFMTFVMVIPAFAADDSIENPVYKSWAKFKVGAMVKYKQEMEMAVAKTESEIIYSLIELTPEKAVVEMKVTTLAMGNRSEMPAMKMEYLAKVPNTTAALASATQAAVVPDTKQGDEEIDVAGKKMKCHFVETNIEQNGSSIVSKLYTNDEVPGTLVKSLTNMEKPMKTTTTLVLIEMKAE